MDIDNPVVQDIEVYAKVFFPGTGISKTIGTVISPDVTSLMPQVNAFMQRICFLAHAMMFSELANKFADIAVSGILPEDTQEIIQACATISMPGGTAASINGIEISFIPHDIVCSEIFRATEIEQASRKLVFHLLTDFAAMGGH